jgi:hypothetical protein
MPSPRCALLRANSGVGDRSWPVGERNTRTPPPTIPAPQLKHSKPIAESSRLVSHRGPRREQLVAAADAIEDHGAGVGTAQIAERAGMRGPTSTATSQQGRSRRRGAAVRGGPGHRPPFGPRCRSVAPALPSSGCHRGCTRLGGRASDPRSLHGSAPAEQGDASGQAWGARGSGGVGGRRVGRTCATPRSTFRDGVMAGLMGTRSMLGPSVGSTTTTSRTTRSSPGSHTRCG